MWTCVKCGTKVDDHFDVCWNCGTSREGVEDPNFVKADDSQPIADPNYDLIADSDPLGLGLGSNQPQGPGAELVDAYQAFSLMEAKFIADQLVAIGVPAMSDTQDLQDGIGAMDGNPRVYVRAIDLPRARVWLEAYDQRKQAEIGRHLDQE